MAEEKEQNALLPEWFTNELVNPFKAHIASEFIIHGDINGLIKNPDIEEEPNKPYISLRQFLEKIFDRGEMVIFYNIASGIRFLTPEMEKKFKKIVGLEADDSDAKDPVAAAKAGLAQKRGIPRESEACFPLIEKALKSVNEVSVIISSVHFIAPASGAGLTLSVNERINTERLKNWGQEEEIRDRNNIVLLLTDQAAKVSSELRQSGASIQTVFIPKPAKAERKEFILSIIKKTKKSKKAEELPNLFSVPADFDAELMAVATQGMSLRQIMEIFMQSRGTGKEVSLDFVKQKKREILNNEYGDVMEVVEPERGLEDIGGHEHIKDYFREILEAIKRGESRLVSMGITLMGPPGTGKTAIVEALAKEAGFNFVKTKNIRSMWVGESEARMEKLLSGLRSLAPVVVMNDEADLAEAGRDSPKGDSGVSERLMKMWMELLSDPKIRGQIVVISCTNRPDRIDPALKRSGRSDDRILMPMPSTEECLAIFKVMFKRHKIPANIKDFSRYAKLVQGLSGADIEKISLNSLRFAFTKEKKEVDGESLMEAIEDFIPNASQSEIDRMTLAGIMECSSRQLLPPHIKEIIAEIQSRNLVENLEAIIAQIKARKIVNLDD